MVQVVKAGAERIDELEPLWLGMHEHHLSIGAEVPLLPAAETWPIRRAEYAEWLAEPDAFALIAEEDARAVGYAVVDLEELDDQRVTGPRYAVLESLAVEPSRRGQGIGRALMRSVYAELRRLGVTQLEIGVIFQNERARAFYEREGFRPWAVEYFGPIPEA